MQIVSAEVEMVVVNGVEETETIVVSLVEHPVLVSTATKTNEVETSKLTVFVVSSKGFTTNESGNQILPTPEVLNELITPFKEAILPAAIDWLGPALANGVLSTEVCTTAESVPH